MKESTLIEFTEALASRKPVPGGGGASALAGSLAASLAAMVGNLTSGKKKFADSEDERNRLIAQAEQLRQQLLDGIEEDAEAFYPLSQAYSLAKDDPSREETMEKCLRDAAQAPLKILTLAGEVLEVLERMLPISSRLAISDIATSAALAEGCLKGAAVNVLVNTELMKDRQHAESLDRQTDKLLSSGCRQARRIYRQVTERMRNHG